MPDLLCLLALFTVLLSAAEGSDKLQIAFCTPEDTKCLLASDGKVDTCFTARHLRDNFYFAVFNTIGQPTRVDRLLLRTGPARGTKYTVSLASLTEARDLNCSAAGPQAIECPAGLENVTSLMIRPEPLPVRLNLLEVAAFDANGTRVNFTYCVAPESPTCQEAMDHRAAADSPAVVSAPAQFPAWYGGVPGTEPVLEVKIYRPVVRAGAGARPMTFFRVRAAKDAGDCELKKPAAAAVAAAGDGVELLEFACSGEPTNLVQVWEVSADFLVSLCEIEVYGK